MTEPVPPPGFRVVKIGIEAPDFAAYEALMLDTGFATMVGGRFVTADGMGEVTRHPPGTMLLKRGIPENPPVDANGAPQWIEPPIYYDEVHVDLRADSAGHPELIDLFYTTIGLPENVHEQPSRSRSSAERGMVPVFFWRLEAVGDPTTWIKCKTDPGSQEELVPPPDHWRNDF